MTARSGHQYTPYYPLVPVVPMAPSKWAPEELFDPLDLANIQAGLHDLLKDADSWIPTFAGEIRAIGNAHWTKFCESYEFHLSGKEHLDTFMRLFLASFIGDARKWSTKLPSKSLKTCEDLEQVFLKRWGVIENMAALYARYIKNYKQDDEDVREFNDRFNTLLNRIEPNFQLERSILQQYLNSFKGEFLFTLRNRFPTNLEEAQDAACRIEENLRLNNSISQVNLLNNQDDILGFNEESMEEREHGLSKILEVENDIELNAFPRKWSMGFSNMEDAFIFSQQHEPPEDLSPPQDAFEDFEVEEGDIECLSSQIIEGDDFEEESPVVFHVGSMGTKYSEPIPFYVTLQINDFLLHNCVFDPDAPRNIVTERVMHQLGLNISQPNTRDGFSRGIIKDLGVAFHACHDVSFKIDVIVIDTLSSWP
jgi:hypothetical protein